MRLSVTTAVALVFLAIALVLDLRVALRGNPPEIPAADMQRARAAIQEALTPGDLVVHSPLFTVASLAGLGDLRATPDLPSPEIRASRRVLLLDHADTPMYGFGDPTE